LLPNDPTPPENLHAMIRASLYNVEAILEQFEAEEKAIYLPRRGGERSRACIPLKEPADISLLSKLIAAPASLIVDIDRKLWLMISIPVGYDLLDSINEDYTPEKALRYTLIEGLGLIQSLKEVKQGNDIVIEMKGSTLSLDLPHYNKILGTLQTSITGCILADEYNTPISLVEENTTPKATTAIFRVIKDE
jgi:hypothetical protein